MKNQQEMNADAYEMIFMNMSQDEETVREGSRPPHASPPNRPGRSDDSDEEGQGSVQCRHS